MTRLGFVLGAILGLASVMVPAPIAAQSNGLGVTGAGEALFPGGATFNGLPLSGLTLGQGVFIAWDGSAQGHFQAVLQGTSLLGQAQDVEVAGEVSGGFAPGDGSVTFRGTATVDMGDGTLSVPGVLFTVTAASGGLALTLDTTSLPAAALTAGSITIE